MPPVRGCLSTKGLSASAQNVIMASWRSGTSKQYHSYLNRWEKHCANNSIDPFNASIESGVEFLTNLFNKGLGYSAINTARSALSTIITGPNNLSFGKHPLVSRFLKGVFEIKPSLPRYTAVWDVGVVLEYLKKMGPNSSLCLKRLTLKLTMLLCILTGQRCQTIAKLDIKSMQSLPDKYIFTLRETLKTSKPGKHLDPITLEAYKPDESLCIVNLLSHYLNLTSTIRNEHSKLLISYVKPHRPITNATIGKWAKTILKEAGIDTTLFSGNSGRPASTSYAQVAGLTLREILKADLCRPLRQTTKNRCNGTLALPFSDTLTNILRYA